MRVSIHAPARGATGSDDCPGRCPYRFNSRTREGCDVLRFLYLYTIDRFNSRTREGCDPALDRCRLRCRRFNSRTREGCDQGERWRRCWWRRFNSRTREGCDRRNGEEAVGLPLQTCFSEGTQIIPSIRCRKHLNSYNRMSMSACECLANC